MEASNRQAMREALDAVLCNWTEDGFGFIKESTIEAVKQALAAPPRNCDVGTVYEQAKRFQNVCKKYKLHNDACEASCPMQMSLDCELAWSQMEYEEEAK